MYAVSEHNLTSTPVVAFLHKLWVLVNDETYDHLICWGESGTSFHIFDPANFARTVLPQYFKHANIASFVRQLNMYGFRKVTSLEQGSLKPEKDALEFAHPYFIRGREELLELIKRKVSLNKVDGIAAKTADIQGVLEDVRTLRTRLDSISNQLGALKRENGALWRELAIMWQRHTKQQQVVGKLLQFLVSLCRGQKRGISLKRPIMSVADFDSGQQVAKISRLDSPGDRPQYDTANNQLTIEDVTDLSDANFFNLPIVNTADITPGGSDALLSYLSPELLAETLTADGEEGGETTKPAVPLAPVSSSNVEPDLFLADNGIVLLASPASVLSPAAGDSSSSTANVASTATTPASNGVSKMPSSSSLASHGSSSNISLPLVDVSAASPVDTSAMNNQLEQMQYDLDTLEQLLGGMQYNFSSNTLKGLFTPEAPLPDADSMMFQFPVLDENDMPTTLAEHLTGEVTVEPVVADGLDEIFDINEFINLPTTAVTSTSVPANAAYSISNPLKRSTVTAPSKTSTVASTTPTKMSTVTKAMPTATSR